MPPDERHHPIRIAQHDARTLAIDWADGGASRIDVRALRLACGCASCVDEWSGRPLLDPAAVPSDVAPREIQPVGRYAIQIRWSDGHEAGIYPFERLRGLADEGLLDPIADD
jgi:ATP-binding protein involved in chromosome partitioning